MKSASAIEIAAGPESRTMPRRPGPGGLAMAAIVSLGSRATGIVT